MLKCLTYYIFIVNFITFSLFACFFYASLFQYKILDHLHRATQVSTSNWMCPAVTSLSEWFSSFLSVKLVIPGMWLLAMSKKEERKSSGGAFSDDRRRFVKLRASVNAALRLLKTKLVYPVLLLSPPLWRAFIMVIAGQIERRHEASCSVAGGKKKLRGSFF